MTNTQLQYIKEFKTEISSAPDEWNEESDYEDFYNLREPLYSPVCVNFIFPDKKEELTFIAPYFTDNFPIFLDNLEKYKKAEYEEWEFTETKWIGEIKGDKVQLTYIDYSVNEPETVFDVLVDKDLFLSFANDLIKTVKTLHDEDKKRYDEFVKEKHEGIHYATNNAILYKKSEDEIGWNIRWLKDNETSCEQVCKKENWTNTYCLHLDKMFFASHLHLLTDIIDFNGKFYFPEEYIPYPENQSQDIGKFEVSMEWEDEEEFCDIDYDEVYRGEPLETDVTVRFPFKKDMDELGIVAKYFAADFPKFIKALKEKNQAVYINEEFSPFKWLVWIKNDKVRIIHQDYRETAVAVEFDVLVDKDCFFETAQNMIVKMQEYADKDFNRYKKYVKEKYNKTI